MRWTSVVAVLALAGLALATEDKLQTLTFAKADAGKLPTGWKAEKTGKGEGSIWKVVEDETLSYRANRRDDGSAEGARAVTGQDRELVRIRIVHDEVRLRVAGDVFGVENAAA